MLDQWYNLKDKQPKLIHSMPGCDGTIEYSNPILVMINNVPVIGYYVKEPFAQDSGEIVDDYVVEISGHTSLSHIAQMTGVDFTDGECFGMDDLERWNLDAYWSEIDMINVLLQIDLLRKEEQDG